MFCFLLLYCTGVAVELIEVNVSSSGMFSFSDVYQRSSQIVLWVQGPQLIAFLFNPQTNLQTADSNDYLQLIWTNMLQDLIPSVWRTAVARSCLYLVLNGDMNWSMKEKNIASQA